MGARRRLTIILLVALGAACKPKERPAPAPAPTVTAPVDRLAPGEIPEGREHAFTMPLPLHSAVKARFPNSIHVASSHTYEELKKFVEARVSKGVTTAGSAETRYDKVIVTKAPAKTLNIEVRAAAITSEYQSQMVIQDVTAAPEPPGMTDADRWRKAGLTPEGKPIDPLNMQ